MLKLIFYLLAVYMLYHLWKEIRKGQRGNAVRGERADRVRQGFDHSQIVDAEFHEIDGEGEKEA